MSTSRAPAVRAQPAARRSALVPGRRALVAAACLALAPGLAAGCGGQTIPPGVTCDVVLSSNHAGMHVCETYPDLTRSEQAGAISDCRSAGGTSSAACSTSDALGVCTLHVWTTVFIAYYGDNGFKASDAESTCAEVGGVWAAG